MEKIVLATDILLEGTHLKCGVRIGIVSSWRLSGMNYLVNKWLIGNLNENEVELRDPVLSLFVILPFSDQNPNLDV